MFDPEAYHTYLHVKHCNQRDDGCSTRLAGGYIDRLAIYFSGRLSVFFICLSGGGTYQRGRKIPGVQDCKGYIEAVATGGERKYLGSCKNEARVAP
jgi:hypothetical protein